MMIATATTTAVLGPGRKAAAAAAAVAGRATGAMGVVVWGRARRVRRQWSRG